MTSGEVSNYSPWRGVIGISILRYTSPSWVTSSDRGHQALSINWYQFTQMYQWKHKSLLLRLDKLLPWLAVSAVASFIPVHHTLHYLLQAKILFWWWDWQCCVNGWRWWSQRTFPALMTPWFCTVITDHPKWLVKRSGVCCCVPHTLKLLTY